MHLIKKHNNSFKRHLWEAYTKQHNIMITKEGKIVRVDVSGPKAVVKTVGTLS